MEKLKKALGVTVTYLLIIAVSVAASLVVRLAVREMRSEPASGLDMSEAANQLNTMAPMMVDEETELMNALGIEGLLVYNYRLVNVDQGTSANGVRLFSVEGYLAHL